MGQKTSPSKLVVSSGGLSRWWIITGVIALVAVAAELVIWLRLPPGPPTIRHSRQITNDGLPKHNLVLSKDGKELYFDEFLSSTSNNSTIMHVSTAGGAIRAVNTTLADPLILDVSAQSELLVSSGGFGTDDVPLSMVSTSSGSAQKLGEAFGHAATWEPGGKLVYVTGKDMYIAEHNGSNARKLMESQGPPFALHFSPDGSRFRFTIGDPISRSTMWEARADGAKMAPVLPLPGWKFKPAPCCGRWTPDGKYFVFADAGDILLVAGRPGKYSEPMQLTSGDLRYRDPVPSPDGKRLYAIGLHPRAQLTRYEASSQQFVPFLGGISAGDIDFSRDGQWVTYVTYPDGSLWRSKADGSEQLRLISPPVRASSARWSPDGKQIAFSGQREGESWKVWLISMDGGSPEVLTPDGIAEADPTWSADGKKLAFVRFSNPSHLIILDRDSRERTELPNSEGLWRPRWSPDGRSLAAVSSGSLAVMICDGACRKWRQLAGNVGTIGLPMWSSDSAYISFDATAKHDSRYLRVRVSGGKLEQLSSLNTIRRYRGFGGFWSGLTPDNTLLLSRDVGENEVYELEWRLP